MVSPKVKPLHTHKLNSKEQKNKNKTTEEEKNIWDEINKK